MTLRELMARHAKGIMTDPDHFGETAIYHFGDGSPDRTVRCTVNRLGRIQDQDGQVGFLQANVFIPSDDTDGVTAVSAQDEITVVMQEGQAAVRTKITDVLSQDVSGFLIEVQVW